MQVSSVVSVATTTYSPYLKVLFLKVQSKEIAESHKSSTICSTMLLSITSWQWSKILRDTSSSLSLNKDYHLITYKRERLLWGGLCLIFLAQSSTVASKTLPIPKVKVMLLKVMLRKSSQSNMRQIFLVWMDLVK
jgi:hypothetical protein